MNVSETDTATPMPPVVSREGWRSARKALLEREKALTRARDALAALRRRLPMVRLEKPYTFDTPEGQRTLLELFAGRRQLIVYHFMFDPAWNKGCPGCTGFVDALGPVDMKVLEARDTSFVLVSRAPLEKLEGYKAQRGWSFPWVSSFGSNFNYDFHVTLDEAVAPLEYNYRSKAELEALGHPVGGGEAHALSVFFQDGGEVFHTYSTYARGCEGLTDAYSLLDVTPYGRQEDWEDSPAGWPQKPTYG
jgi:predicted dithiol-disulfide oxidoreductase (DUF899 family)